MSSPKRNIVLALIPARGGSKGVPRKNLKPLCGKPLIAWTIEAALNAKYVDRVVVSTEDEEIATEARKWGAEVPFIRPMQLAQDDTHRNLVVRHALEEMPGFDYIVLLQPTSPLRTADDITISIRMVLEKDADSCVSVVKHHASPYWMFVKNDKGAFEPFMDNWVFPRRQDLPDVYALNGAIFVSKTHSFFEDHYPDPFLTPNSLMYEMPNERSIDIDGYFDLKCAETFIQSKGN